MMQEEEVVIGVGRWMPRHTARGSMDVEDFFKPSIVVFFPSMVCAVETKRGSPIFSPTCVYPFLRSLVAQRIAEKHGRDGVGVVVICCIVIRVVVQKPHPLVLRIVRWEFRWLIVGADVRLVVPIVHLSVVIHVVKPRPVVARLRVNVLFAV